LNLSPFGAKDNGVSRVHAALRRERDRWLLVDLGSTNGTRLNGVRLAAHDARPIASGDQIELGTLVVRVNFS
jgi:pSer/pThr/pTyr-binding forkhead associated (FHA) protein